MEKEHLKQAAQMLKQSKHTIAITGAGLSYESGIHDFRLQNGVWREYDLTTIATTEVLNHHYHLFYQFYRERLLDMDGKKPHRGYDLLVQWEREGLLQTIITQNVDNLHQEAGGKNIFEIHGNIHSIYCNDCQKENTKESFLQQESCFLCGGVLRPGVILFGEELPTEIWDRVIYEIQKADLLLIIGTSLQVTPVRQIPLFLSNEGKIILINREETFLDLEYHLFFKQKASLVLMGMEEYLSKEN